MNKKQIIQMVTDALTSGRWAIGRYDITDVEARRLARLLYKNFWIKRQ